MTRELFETKRKEIDNGILWDSVLFDQMVDKYMEKYGEASALTIAAEEANELLTAITNINILHDTSNDAFFNLLEETADVVLTMGYVNRVVNGNALYEEIEYEPTELILIDNIYGYILDYQKKIFKVLRGEDKEQLKKAYAEMKDKVIPNVYTMVRLHYQQHSIQDALAVKMEHLMDILDNDKDIKTEPDTESNAIVENYIKYLEDTRHDTEDDTIKPVKGYKVFNPDWTCKGFKYEVGKSYEMGDNIKCCKKGFHFYTRLADCFYYRGFNPDNKVAEVEAYGKIDYSKEDTKACTNKIKIVREVSWDDVLSVVNIGIRNAGSNNIGNYNDGSYNTGSRNTGDYNTGHSNTGNYNSGDRNTGSFNSGKFNVGSYNTVWYNVGDYNSGNGNTGNHNTGSFNVTNHSNGYFCTEEPTVVLFNKPTDMTYKEWTSTRAYDLLYNILCITDRGGQELYDNSPDEDKDAIKSIPNFDADIFKQCTGIDVGID